MNLADQQRKLLGLFRSTYQPRPEDDAYIRHVAESKDLAEGRRNIFLWRIFVLERTCALTFRLLRKRRLLEETLEGFISAHNISPFRETQAPDFLAALNHHHDSLIVSVAQFELALLKVRNGDSASYVIPWRVEPHAVLYCLAKDLPLPENFETGSYEILVSHDLPSHFEVVALN